METEKTIENSDITRTLVEIKPQDSINLGQIRKILTGDLIQRASSSDEEEFNLGLYWKDFSPMNDPPRNLDTEEKNKPIYFVDGHTSEFNSRSEEILDELETVLDDLGVEIKIFKESNEIKSGNNIDRVKTALENREEIAEIAENNLSQNLTSEEISNYYPIQVISRFSNRPNTEIIDWDGDSKIKYRCFDTGKKDTIDIETDFLYNLVEEVERPLIWDEQDIDLFITGFGDEANISNEISLDLAEKLQNNQKPSVESVGGLLLDCEFIDYKNREIITPEELLNIYSPETVRWLFYNSGFDEDITISLDDEVFKVYSEYDRFIESMNSTDEQIISVGREIPDQITSFRSILGMGEATNYQAEKVQELLDRQDKKYSEEIIEERLENSDYWSRNYKKDLRNTLLKEPNREYIESMDEEERKNIKELSIAISEEKDLGLEEIENLVYSIPKQNMAEDKQKQIQRKFFENSYNLLFGTDHGPRLATYLWASEDKKEINELLNCV